MSDEWFRDSQWDDAARADFEKRLSRTRAYNRPQYLRIKALAIREAGLLDEARTLLLRALVEEPNAFCTELLGDLVRQQGRTSEAESHYRAALRDWPDQNGTSGNIEISLAEVLLAREDQTVLREAAELLQSRLSRGSLFNNDLFRLYVALVTAAGRLGDDETKTNAAKRALGLIGKGPQLPRHPTVGLVEADDLTLTWLRQIVESAP